MSMIMYVLRITPEQAAKLRADVTLLEGVRHIASHLSSGRTTQQLLAELAQRSSLLDPNFRGSPHDWISHLEATVKAAAALNLDAAFCLGKEWHMLHFFLNGTGDVVDAPSGALFSGEEIGADDGYGPARLVEPEVASAFAALVTSLTAPGILARVDVAAMDDLQIYGAPRRDDTHEPAELTRAISSYFPRFQQYLAEARMRGDGLLIWIE